MLKNIDLKRKLSKSEFKSAEDETEIRLGTLQRQCRDLEIPVVIVYEGWDAAGKGTLINHLILPLDPRGFRVHPMLRPKEDEKLYAPLRRYWIRTPAAGRIAIFDRAWYRHVVDDAVEGELSDAELGRIFQDIRSFERQLADDGAVIVKFFLHISKKEQAKRFDKLRDSKTTAWRVTEADLARHKKYKTYLAGWERALSETDTDHAPWTIVEAHDERFASMKIFRTVINALSRRVDQAQRDEKPVELEDVKPPSAEMPEPLRTSILAGVDLSQKIDKKSTYKKRLDKFQKRLRELEHQIYIRRVPVLLVYEGWDAAGKGGNIKRLTRELDPRGYEVVPIAAPNDIEKAHHYLWRFWKEMPKAGHMTIFDRSWYGRVMVERVEGFCSEAAWRRAYREINEMEQHLAGFGTVVLKFWLQISPEEQLERFEARKATPHKTWKITEEDWRNREKWDAYEQAVEEMLFRTSTPHAPWTIVESNDKRFARVKALQTVCEAIEQRLG